MSHARGACGRIERAIDRYRNRSNIICIRIRIDIRTDDLDRDVGTVQQRWNACRVHSAAAELHEQLAAPGAAPVGDDTVASVLRQLGPPDPSTCPVGSWPLHVDPREISLADIDAAGLAPLASLFKIWLGGL